MSRSQETIVVPHRQWVQLTDSDTTEITFQVLSGTVEILAGTSAEPGAEDRGWRYHTGQGERALALTSITNAASTRVWARGFGAPESHVIVDYG